MKAKKGNTKNDIQRPVIKRRASKRVFLMAVGGIIGAAGLVMFVIYIVTMNIVIGMPGVFMSFIGGILFYIYWKKEDQMIVEAWEKQQTKEQFNALSIYEDNIKFENVTPVTGQVPWRCTNDSRPYYVFIWDKITKQLVPFQLPDQKFYDPRVFAERVLDLPDHQRLFARKEDLFQKLKPLLVLGAILIVWILIITTT